MIDKETQVSHFQSSIFLLNSPKELESLYSLGKFAKRRSVPHDTVCNS